MGEETGSESDDDDDDENDEGDSDSDDDDEDDTVGDYVPDESGTDDEETIARDEKAEMQEDAVAQAGLRIRIRIGSGINRVNGSGFGIRIRIQEGKNDPQK
jgi:hypothetical protein